MVGHYESFFITSAGAYAAVLGLLVVAVSVEQEPQIHDIRDRARYWGWAIGTGYGEPFVCREEVGLRSLRDLL